jgi:hypothetical protein
MITASSRSAMALAGVACAASVVACQGALSSGGASGPDAGARPDGGPPGIDDRPDAGVVDYVAITALANGRFVSADDGGAAPLVADRPAVGDWERFTVVENADGSIALRARANDRFVSAAGGQLVASATSIGATESFRKIDQDDGSFGLQSVASGQFVSADLNEGAVLHVNRAAIGGAWEAFTFAPAPAGPSALDPDLGPNVLVFDPSMPASVIQGRLDAVFAAMESNHFGPERYAILFKPGRYDVDVNVGFYTQVLGLGASPDDVTIRGQVHAEADWFDGNATQNFWRGVENMAVEPAGGTMRWAVSQAAPFRRMHVRGNMILDDSGWSSGGFMADSVVDGQIDSGSQQQWFTRSTTMGSWTGANWNMVFAGVSGAPGGAERWPNPPYTVIPRIPVVREKPSLVVDREGRYGVFVPALRKDGVGPTWGAAAPAGRTLPITDFHVARPSDGAAALNAALAAGKHVLFTPGIYHLDQTLRVDRPGTVLLGLGLATLIPDGGLVAMRIADVDGVILAGVLFDAGETSSPVLLEVGAAGASADHAANPTSIHDVFFRVGGAAVGRADVSVTIHSDDVIGDHFWVWRADHTYGVGWDLNTTKNGMIVNGDDVTVYGLFVEHYHQYQTIWNGERGRVYFYQSEIPYDVPSQGAWLNGGKNGYASYKVADRVTQHEVIGMGIYCFFDANPSVRLGSAVEVPDRPGVTVLRAMTVSLGGKGEITNVVNGRGNAANGQTIISHLGAYP